MRPDRVQRVVSVQVAPTMDDFSHDIRNSKVDSGHYVPCAILHSWAFISQTLTPCTKLATSVNSEKLVFSVYTTVGHYKFRAATVSISTCSTGGSWSTATLMDASGMAQTRDLPSTIIELNGSD